MDREEYLRILQEIPIESKKIALRINILNLIEIIPTLLLTLDMMTDEQIEALFRKIFDMDVATTSLNLTYAEAGLLSVLSINSVAKG